jgi:hypothetical protein
VLLFSGLLEYKVADVAVKLAETITSAENLVENTAAESFIDFDNMVCKKCNLSFKSAGGLSTHVSTKHKNVKYSEGNKTQCRFVCNHCNKACSNAYKLRRHLIVHTGKCLNL